MINKIAIITKIFTKYAKSNPGYYFLSVIFFPIALLIPLYFLVNPANRINIFIGSAICTTTIMTIADISDIISHDKYSKSVSFFVTRPVTPYEYVLGVGVSTLFYNLIGIIVVFVFGLVILRFSFAFFTLFAVFLIVLVGWFISCSLGFIIGMWGPREPRTNTSVASIIGYFLTFIAPAYYPIDLLPKNLQYISKVLYTTNLSILGKQVLGNEKIEFVPIFILLAYIFISIIILFKLAKWNTDS